MDFSNTTDKSGIVQDIDFLVGSDSTSYPLTIKAANANRAQDEVVSLILGCDGRWQFDDTNYTNLPIGTTDLAANQQDYSIDVEVLDITRIECKDINGNWQLLIPFDQRDLTPPLGNPTPIGTLTANATLGGNNYSLTDFMSTAGTPVYYDKIANSIFLYPKPSYNSVGGLKVYFQRKPSYFASTDTTKQPGFAKIFHRIISYKAAYDYAIAKMLPTGKIQALMNDIQKMEQSIRTFYSSRKKDEKVVMIARSSSSL